MTDIDMTERQHGTIYYSNHSTKNGVQQGYISKFYDDGEKFISVEHGVFETILRFDDVDKIVYHSEAVNR